MELSVSTAAQPSHTGQTNSQLVFASLDQQVLQISQIWEHVEPGTRLVLNFSGVQQLSGLEAATLLRLVAEGQQKKIEVRFSRLSAEARQAFAGLEVDILSHIHTSPARLSSVEQVGDQTIALLTTARRLLDMIGELSYWFGVAPWRGKGVKWDRTGEQVVKIGPLDYRRDCSRAEWLCDYRRAGHNGRIRRTRCNADDGPQPGPLSPLTAYAGAPVCRALLDGLVQPGRHIWWLLGGGHAAWPREPQLSTADRSSTPDE